MTASAARAVQEAVSPEAPETSPQAQTPAPARESNPPAALVTAPSDGGGAVTQSVRERAQIWAAQTSVKVMAHFTGPSLLHEPRPSLAAKREHHHTAAGHWNAGLAKWSRLAWGYLVHLPVKAAAHFADWLFESPVIACCAFAIYTACHFWLWRFLPWF